ncbi:MAG: FAD/FMN-containing dehydrogenase [Paenibacillaceae bacterium]|nr:FAD/FMN-containing dehydrogenase [Paenibacillaceae bacterium]
MKKLGLGIAALVLVMGMGAAGVYAAGANNGAENDSNEGWDWMLPYAKQMHPNLTDEQIKEQINNCHGQNGTGTSGMMNPNFRGGRMTF